MPAAGESDPLLQRARPGGVWPVEFVPVFSPLTQEAVEQAETADFEGVELRVIRADHLAVIALSVGRAKDLTRILALLESVPHIKVRGRAVDSARVS